MTSRSDLPGLEIFFTTVSTQLQSKHDALVALVHFALINEGFKCLGTGDQFPDQLESAAASELLPEGWNSNQQTYILRYYQSSTKRTLLLKLVSSEPDLLVNALVRPGDLVAACTLDTNEFISNNYGQFSTLFSNDNARARLVNEVRTELLEKLSGNASNPGPSGSGQEQQQQARHPQQFPYGRPPPPALPLQDDYPRPAPRPFPQIGGADLDPLGRGIGGGMLMDPSQFEQVRLPRPGMFPSPYPRFDPSSGLDHRLPPGAVPPGARFEYFGPPRHRRPGGPSNHPDLRPPPDDTHPPDYDDMFM